MVDVQNQPQEQPPPSPPSPPPLPATASLASMSEGRGRTGFGARVRRIFPNTKRGWLALAGAVAVSLMVLAWMLSRLTPGWYAPLSPDDYAVMDDADRAFKLFLELHNATQRVPLGEQRWSITQDELNSYLAVDRAQPLNADGTRTPPATIPLISDPVVIFSQDQVTVAARCSRIPGPDPRGGVGSAVFSVKIVDEGGTRMGLVKLESVWIGCLPVPRSLLGRQLQAELPQIVKEAQREASMRVNAKDIGKVEEYVQEVLQDITHAKPFTLRYTIDRKQLVIKDLKVEKGRFSVAFVPPTPAAVMPRPAK